MKHESYWILNWQIFVYGQTGSIIAVIHDWKTKQKVYRYKGDTAKAKCVGASIENGK